MDKEAINRFLGYLGAETAFPRPASWDLRQLRYANLHFGVCGEDAVLFKMFRRQLGLGVGGTFADIGALTPCEMSNTYLFYRMGWRGIAVDANPELAAKWSDARPEDRFLHAAVGEQEGRAFWFRHRTNLGMSMVSSEPVAPSAEHDPAAVEVPMRRLDSIFAEHLGDRPLDLLCMDIEETELPALKSNDWNRWRPKVVLVEAHGFQIDAPHGDPCVAFMREQGYRPSMALPGNVILTPD